MTGRIVIARSDSDVAIQKINSLETLPVSSSGLDELNQDFKRDLDYQNYLKQFLNGDNESLDKFFQENPHLIDSIKTKALFLLNLITTKQKVMPFHISVSGFKPKLADNSAFELINLVKELDYEYDFYELKNVLPTIVIYYSDYLLKEKYFKTQDKALLERVRAVIEDDSCFDDLVDEDLIAQKYRLRALYHRRCHSEGVKRLKNPMHQDYLSTGSFANAQDDVEKNLLLYRKHFKPDLTKKVHLNTILPSRNYEADQVLDNLADIYKEVTDIQEEVLVRSGVYEDTCFYYQCSDCCKKDFPTVSLVEFLYIKNNLSDEEFKKVKEKAELIQALHGKQYGTRLQVVDQALPGKQKENPNNFQSACPFLDEKDMCSIHTTTRPLACRSFGLSTIDDESVQACKFYLTQYQYNSSHRNERDVYDSDPHTQMIGEANELLAKQHGFGHMKQPVGTLVSWLTEAT